MSQEGECPMTEQNGAKTAYPAWPTFKQPVSVVARFVVARWNRALYEQLIREFSGENRVKVVMDRRGEKRRRRAATREHERRQADRRRQPEFDAVLRNDGIICIRYEETP
jgi:hypothetical protein